MAEYALLALMNYHWSKSPHLLAEPINKLIAGLAAAVSLGSAAWYMREGDRKTGGLLSGVGVLQIWAVMQEGGA
jgi:hypothetical protein